MIRTCETCEGSGKYSMPVQVYENGKFVNKPAVEMTCPTCEGRGNFTEKEWRELEEQRAKWCSCKECDGQAYSVPANVRPDCPKHHWRCVHCVKIVQAG